jgi:uncharacterized protein (UPF0332 family)
MNKEIEKVVLKSKDFLEDADYLFKGSRFEAVINRSYYAMFTIVQGLLLSKGVFSKTHQGTMIKFQELFIKTGLLPVELGKVLNETFEKRQFGDYDVDADISEEDALKVLEKARSFIEKIKDYLIQSDRIPGT